MLWFVHSSCEYEHSLLISGSHLYNLQHAACLLMSCKQQTQHEAHIYTFMVSFYSASKARTQQV